MSDAFLGTVPSVTYGMLLLFIVNKFKMQSLHEQVITHLLLSVLMFLVIFFLNSIKKHRRN